MSSFSPTFKIIFQLGFILLISHSLLAKCSPDKNLLHVVKMPEPFQSTLEQTGLGKLCKLMFGQTNVKNLGKGVRISDVKYPVENPTLRKPSVAQDLDYTKAIRNIHLAPLPRANAINNLML